MEIIACACVCPVSSGGASGAVPELTNARCVVRACYITGKLREMYPNITQGTNALREYKVQILLRFWLAASAVPLKDPISKRQKEASGGPA